MAPTKTLPSPVAVLGIFIAAIVPIMGIFFLGWDWREILIFYWLGNITVGVQVVVSMLRATSVEGLLSSVIPGATLKSFTVESQQPDMAKVTLGRGVTKAIMISFFCLHYGLFTVVHGVFVFIITSGGFFSTTPQGQATDQPVLHLSQILLMWLIASVVQIVFELLNRRTEVTMSAAYARIVVLHLSIIVGAFLITALRWPASAAVLLVAINFCFELGRLLLAKKSAMSPVLPGATV